MRRTLIILILLLPTFGASGQRKELADYVNTLQGTDSRYELSRGNTYPVTALPFGMHVWTARTGANGDGWKYQYEKNTIRGFHQSHQGYKNYYIIEFDKPMREYGTWDSSDNTISPGNLTDGDRGKGAWVSFDPGAKVEAARIASSVISP